MEGQQTAPLRKSNQGGRVNKAQIKLQRVAEVNAVIKAISNHGRRFFFSNGHQRVAEFRIGNQGQILFYDDYTWHPVYVAYKYRWRGFSHGGTLQGLVEMMRDYIRSGTTIPIVYIGLERVWKDGDVWGYGKEAIQAVRDELNNSPVFCTPEETTQ
jgi:hypothetical protein